MAAAESILSFGTPCFAIPGNLELAGDKNMTEKLDAGYLLLVGLLSCLNLVQSSGVDGFVSRRLVMYDC